MAALLGLSAAIRYVGLWRLDAGMVHGAGMVMLIGSIFAAIALL